MRRAIEEQPPHHRSPLIRGPFCRQQRALTASQHAGSEQALRLAEWLRLGVGRTPGEPDLPEMLTWQSKCLRRVFCSCRAADTKRKQWRTPPPTLLQCNISTVMVMPGKPQVGSSHNALRSVVRPGISRDPRRPIQPHHQARVLLADITARPPRRKPSPICPSRCMP